MQQGYVSLETESDDGGSDGFREEDSEEEEFTEDSEEEAIEDDIESDMAERVEQVVDEDLWMSSFVILVRLGSEPQRNSIFCALASFFGYLVFLIGCQGGLSVLVALFIYRGKRQSWLGILNTYGDAVDKLFLANNYLLSSDDTKQMCGEFGDQKDTTPAGDTFAYNKLPLQNWAIYKTVASQRSELDNTIFVMEYISWFNFAVILTMFLWYCASFREAFQIRSELEMLIKLEIVKAHDMFRPEHAPKQQEPRVNGVTVWVKGLGYFSAIVRTAILLLLVFTGTLMLIMTNDMIELILNALSLAFVLEIDEIVYQAFTPRDDKKLMSSLKVMPDRYTKQACIRRNLRAPLIFAACFGAALIMAVLGRLAQIKVAEKGFSLIAPACLFLGPTPDTLRSFNATFPVVGLCESLLDAKCYLPGTWETDTCLYDKQSSMSSACAFYPQKDMGKQPCIITEPGKQEAQMRGVEFLKDACNKMYKTKATSQTHGYLEEYPHPLAPQVDLAETSSFYRMRDVSKSENMFSGPFFCQTSHTLEAAIRSTKEQPWGSVGRFFLGTTSEITHPVDFNSIEMTDALAGCNKSHAAMPVTVHGVSGDACISHSQCQGFCTLLHVCESDCQQCQACSVGLNNTCGPTCNFMRKCIDVRKPTEKIEWAKQRGLDLYFDNASGDWFFHNRSSGLSSWSRPGKSCARSCAICIGSGSPPAYRCLECDYGYVVDQKGACAFAQFLEMFSIGSKRNPWMSLVKSGQKNIGKLLFFWRQLYENQENILRFFVLMSDSTLWGFGSNKNGELGDGTIVDNELQGGGAPRWMRIKEPIASVAPSLFNTFAIATNGNVWLCGTRVFPPFGIKVQSFPVRILQGLGPVKAIAIELASQRTFFLMKNGTLLMGDPTLDRWYKNGSLDIVPLTARASSMSAGSMHTAILLESGAVVAIPFQENQAVTEKLLYQKEDNIVAVSAGTNCTAALARNGSIWCLGCGRYGNARSSSSHKPIRCFERAAPAEQIIATHGQTYVRPVSQRKSHKLKWFCYGNSYGCKLFLRASKPLPLQCISSSANLQFIVCQLDSRRIMFSLFSDVQFVLEYSFERP